MAVTRKTGTGTVATFNDKTLAKPVSYSFDYDAPASTDEAKSAGVWPNDADILSSIVSDNERKAKASGYQETVKKFRLLYDQTVTAIRDEFIAAAVKGKMTVEKATALAEQNISETLEMAQAQTALDALINGTA